MTFLSKSIATTLSVLALTTALSTPSFAKDGNNANLLGGLAAGALVGGVVGNVLGRDQQMQQQQQQVVQPQPVYVERPRRVVVEEEECRIIKKKTFDEDGRFIGYRKIRVCD